MRESVAVIEGGALGGGARLALTQLLTEKEMRKRKAAALLPLPDALVLEEGGADPLLLSLGRALPVLMPVPRAHDPLALPLPLLLLHAPLLRLVALGQSEASIETPEEELAESENPALLLPLPIPMPLLEVRCSERVGAPAEAQAVGGAEALSPRDCTPLPLPEATLLYVALRCALLLLPALPDPPEAEAWRVGLGVALPVVDAEAQEEAEGQKEAHSEKALEPVE